MGWVWYDVAPPGARRLALRPRRRLRQVERRRVDPCRPPVRLNPPRDQLLVDDDAVGVGLAVLVKLLRQEAGRARRVARDHGGGATAFGLAIGGGRTRRRARPSRPCLALWGGRRVWCLARLPEYGETRRRHIGHLRRRGQRPLEPGSLHPQKDSRASARRPGCSRVSSKPHSGAPKNGLPPAAAFIHYEGGLVLCATAQIGADLLRCAVPSERVSSVGG